MSFDAVAPVYRVLETLVFGNALQRARTAFIPQLDRSRHALLAGEGNGRFLACVHAEFSQLRVDCVDSSAEMLRLSQDAVARRSGGLRQRTGSGTGDDRVRSIQADLRAWESDTLYDAIVTNFFLDCLGAGDLALVIDSLNRSAAPKARWLVSEFTLPSGKSARWYARALIAGMYAFFRITTRISATRLIDYSPLLTAHGFSRTAHRRFYFGMVKAELWER